MMILILIALVVVVVLSAIVALGLIAALQNDHDVSPLVVGLVLVAFGAAACSSDYISPTPAPAPQSAGQVDPVRPELPPNPEPTYHAYLSAWSTVIRHPPMATLALDANAPIVGYVHADPAPVRFEWDFDDGAGGRFASSVGRVEYRYRSTGWKTINVSIVDERGRRAQNSVQVLMLAYPPEWF